MVWKMPRTSQATVNRAGPTMAPSASQRTVHGAAIRAAGSAAGADTMWLCVGLLRFGSHGWRTEPETAAGLSLRLPPCSRSPFAVRFEGVPGVVLPHHAGVLSSRYPFLPVRLDLAGAVELPPLRQARQ